MTRSVSCEANMRCEGLESLSNARLTSPSAERNKAPIADVLCEALPKVGVVLEIGSGTGQHIVHFARAMPEITWQPSECDPACLRSIAAWVSLDALPNVRVPLWLDVYDAPWRIPSVNAIVCINLIHIAPQSATAALMRGAGATLAEGGLLYLYGPYRRRGQHTSASNRAFDAYLRATNADWGVRDLDEVAKCAETVGLQFLRTFEMPSNNLSVVFRRS